VYFHTEPLHNLKTNALLENIGFCQDVLIQLPYWHHRPSLQENSCNNTEGFFLLSVCWTSVS